MQRVILFHGYSSSDPRLAELCQKTKELFEKENFRLNFFSIDHKDSEIEQSFKSQSVTKPIEVLFDPSCPSYRIPQRQGHLRKSLSKFKVIMYQVGATADAYSHAKSIITKRIENAARVGKKLVEHARRKRNTGYGRRNAAA